MGRAGDARVVVADRLLALPGESVLWKVEIPLDETAQILFDGLIVKLAGAERISLQMLEE